MINREMKTLDQIALDVDTQLCDERNIQHSGDWAIEFARRLVAALGAQEPVARLLRWKGPSHMPVPHGGVAARTFKEFLPETPSTDRYWFEGEPLYAAPVVTKPAIDPNCTCDEHGACAYCWSGKKHD